MTCDELRTYLETTLAEERQAQQMEQVRRHAQHCPACAACLSELLELEQDLGRLPSIVAHAEVLENVMRRIGEEPAAALVPAPARVRASADEAIREVMWRAAMLLGMGLAALAWSGSASNARWLEQLWSLRSGLTIAGPMTNLLQQPLPIWVAGGLGLVLIAASVFWECAPNPNLPRRQ